MGFTPSIFQKAVFDFITDGNGSAIVEAVAGSGKSTTILEALALIAATKKVVFLAFNKSIAEELKSKAPNYVDCMTMNALGHKAVFKKFGRVALDANKTSLIIERLVDSGKYTDQEARFMASTCKKLVNIAKSVGIVPKTLSNLVSLLPDTNENWNAIFDHFDIEVGSEEMDADQIQELKNQIIDFTRVVLHKSIEEVQIIDFNDQLYFPVIFSLPVFAYDWVFVDEAQDVSAIQRALLLKAKKKIGRLVAVGDPAQAIYGFRGADSDSLKNIAKTFNCVTLPLSISYRCPKAVVREAQRFVSHIQSSETAPEGVVKDLGFAKPEMFKADDMVVCRSSAPIIQLAYSLISKKIPAKVMGRELGEGLITLIKKLKARSVSQLADKLDDWFHKETKKLLDKDPEANISKVEDKFECLNCFIKYSGADTVDGVITAIQNLFGEVQVGFVILSTIHKSKGLEAKRVFILDSWRMPSPYAKKPHQIEQENNLFYVAVTRSKEELYYVDMPDKKEVQL